MPGTITFDGLGSGLNTTDIINKLIDVESRPKILKQAEQTRLQNEQAAWQQLSTKLQTLQTSTTDLWKTQSWDTLKVDSTNTDIVTASTVYGAKPGTYTLSVEQLALNGQQASQKYAAATSLVGAGTLTVKVGSTQQDIAVTDTDTLTSLATKINDLKIGATASLIMDGTQYRLLVTADQTGTANDVTLTGSVATSLSMTRLQAAQDAVVKFGTTDAGLGSTAMTYTSSTNKVTGLIQGVTLNLNKASPGQAVTLSTSVDSSSIQQKVQTFVDAYNDFTTSMNNLTAYNEKTQVSGVLQADGSARPLSDRIKNIIGGSAGTSGAYRTLRSVGVTMNDDGTLSFDQTKFATAITADSTTVENLFRDTNTGVMQKLKTYLTTATTPVVGVVDRKLTSLGTSLEDTQKRIDEMDALLKAKRDSLSAQFAAMESAISNMNGQQSFLTSQLAGINKNWGTSSG